MNQRLIESVEMKWDENTPETHKECESEHGSESDSEGGNNTKEQRKSNDMIKQNWEDMRNELNKEYTMKEKMKHECTTGTIHEQIHDWMSEALLDDSKLKKWINE